MSSNHPDEGEELHYSEKGGTGEQQKHATQTYTYKSCRPDSRPEHKIKIHVRNISWLPLRKSLVKELVGNIYDRDQVKLGVDKDKKDQEKRFSHSDQSRTIKWTVDQRDGMVQLYTYDISGPARREHPSRVWMQYTTLLGSGYVFNDTASKTAWEDISNEAKRIFVHTRPDPESTRGDWIYSAIEGKTDKYELIERGGRSWSTDTKPESRRNWLARATTQTLKPKDILPYTFKGYKLQVSNSSKKMLNLMTLGRLVQSIDPKEIKPVDHSPPWETWQVTEERNSKTGKPDLIISRYHRFGNCETYYTENKYGQITVYISNYTDDQDYNTVRGLLKSTSKFRILAKHESKWILNKRPEEGKRPSRLILYENSDSSKKKTDFHKTRESHRGYESSGSGSDSSVYFSASDKPSRATSGHFSSDDQCNSSDDSRKSRGRSGNPRAYESSPSRRSHSTASSSTTSSGKTNPPSHGYITRHETSRNRRPQSIAFSEHGRYIKKDPNYDTRSEGSFDTDFSVRHSERSIYITYKNGSGRKGKGREKEKEEGGTKTKTKTFGGTMKDAAKWLKASHREEKYRERKANKYQKWLDKRDRDGERRPARENADTDTDVYPGSYYRHV